MIRKILYIGGIVFGLWMLLSILHIEVEVKVKDHKDGNHLDIDLPTEQRYFSLGDPSREDIDSAERLQSALRIVYGLQDWKDFSTKDCIEQASHSYLEAANLRYANLSAPQPPIRSPHLPVRPPTYFFAINLHNNQAIISDLIFQLSQVITHLGAQNCFVSIFENGSTDNTKNVLKDTTMVLDILNVPYTIVISNISKPGKIVVSDSLAKDQSRDRIAYLAKVRNNAIVPLFTLKAPPYNREYDHIIFMNDVVLCKNDLLELLYQRILNKAHITCAMDYFVGSVAAVYDNWVGRARTGFPVYRDPIRPFRDDYSQNKYMAGLPLQAYCCWNGISVLDPGPFYEHHVRFRRGKLPADPLKPTEGECAASECSLICKDFYALGYDKVMWVPRVKVGYDSFTYNWLHSLSPDAKKEMPALKQFRRFDAPFLPEESEPLIFDPPPKSQYCQGWYEENIRKAFELAVWEDIPVPRYRK